MSHLNGKARISARDRQFNQSVCINCQSKFILCGNNATAGVND
jgi:hypothetical protein